jgi:hypothetical protein
VAMNFHRASFVMRRPPLSVQSSGMTLRHRLQQGAMRGAAPIRFNSTAAAPSPPPTSSGGILTRISTFGKKNPFIFQLGIATCKTCIADILVQVTIDGKNFDEIDWARNAVFVAFGFGYLGCVQYFFYVKCMRFLWPGMDRFAALPTLRAKLQDMAGLRTLVGQVMTDCFIITPCFYYPGRSLYSSSFVPLPSKHNLLCIVKINTNICDYCLCSRLWL